MLKVCDGCKMGWIQIKMGHPLAQNVAALAPFRALVILSDLRVSWLLRCLHSLSIV